MNKLVIVEWIVVRCGAFKSAVKAAADSWSLSTGNNAGERLKESQARQSLPVSSTRRSDDLMQFQPIQHGKKCQIPAVHTSEDPRES